MSSLAFFAALALAGAGPDRLPPIDQCSADPSFRAFRIELARIVERRDAAAMLALVADDVMIDFGPDGEGKAGFVKAWQLNRPRSSALWDEIKTILRLGCKVEAETWGMPSLGSQLDDSVDPLETFIAIEPGSALRSTARDDAPVIARLDWDVLTLRDVSPDTRWLRVSLRDGRTGYVRKEQVRNPLDYRMVVQRLGGKLRITAFVAGD